LAEQKVDWVEVFGDETILKQKDIVERVKKYQISDATIDRLLKSKQDTAGHGKYKLFDPDQTEPVAA
jgi:hypothetical protein